MPSYKLQFDGGVLKDGVTSVPADPSNTDWQEYQDWLQQGNFPEPADLPPQPEDHSLIAEIGKMSRQDRTRLAELILNPNSGGLVNGSTRSAVSNTSVDRING